ncbi:hypothetical protein [Knoellia koreensis]|uniref:Uncharacterized protein n=1 Tax=Knoellia koreensis TaxID=2730921 RepID=A0A849HLF0_9MICO|nr:hypothetical protein [Knoellia sp. DB2414S]NNM47374.1 hypothetical protein [Knoellia sp. DB2414S]
MSEPAPTPAPAMVPAAAVRAQILATEHWSLLATRSMTWGEVMSRITIHLTVTSASLVVLALVAQASGFGKPFHVMAIGLASSSLILGTLTVARVHNASSDDAAMLLGMNRLRAAYLELDPGIERYLVTSANDDLTGLMRSYTMGWRRSVFSHVAASTSIFLAAVNSIVAGTLGALVADAVGGSTPVVALAGVLAGLAYLAVMLDWGRRTFAAVPWEPRFPSG